MLTKSDLEQIGKIFDLKLDAKLNSTLDTKLKPIKKDINYIKKSMELIVKNYDEADTKLAKRVKKLEDRVRI